MSVCVCVRNENLTCLFVFVLEILTDTVLLQSSSRPASDQKSRWSNTSMITVKLITVKLIIVKFITVKFITSIKIMIIKITVPQWASGTWGQGWDIGEEGSKRSDQSLWDGHLMRISTSIIVTIVVIMYCDEMCLGWAALELCLNLFENKLPASFLNRDQWYLCLGRKVTWSRKPKRGPKNQCGVPNWSLSMCALVFFCLAITIPLWHMKLKYRGYKGRQGGIFTE